MVKRGRKRIAEVIGELFIGGALKLRQNEAIKNFYHVLVGNGKWSLYCVKEVK